MPRSPSSSALFKRVTVELPAAEFEALSVRAKAAGVPVGALLRDDRETQASVFAADLARAVAAQQKVVNAEFRDLKREHREAMDTLRQEHAAEMTAAAEQAQLDVNAAYLQGRAEADPTLQLQHQVDQLELRRYEATFDAYENHGTNLGQAVDQVLAYIGDRLTDPWAGERHRKYVEATHELMRQFDQMLNGALQPMAQADGGWLDRHERERAAKQAAAIARAEREAHADRTRTRELIGEQMEAAVADGDKRARDELAPELARLQTELDDALGKLAHLGPVQEELADAGWAGREAYVQSIMDGLRRPVPVASPHQLAEGDA